MQVDDEDEKVGDQEEKDERRARVKEGSTEDNKACNCVTKRKRKKKFTKLKVND